MNMKNWTDPQARIDATWDFVKRMRTDPAKRQRAIANNDNDAKKLFAEGWFYLKEDPKRDPAYVAIPTEVEFHIYNDEPITQRDNLVAIVLPDDGVNVPLPPRLTKDVEDVWKCTWSAYVTLESVKKAP
jgi:hypothetical protein